MVLTPEYTKTLNFKKELKKPDECSLELFFEKIKEAIRSTDDGEKALRSMEYFHAGGNMKMIRPGSRETFYADIQPGVCEGILVCFYYSPDGTRDTAAYIGSAKTLEEDSSGYIHIGSIAGLFIRFAYMIMYLNFN